MKTEHCPKCGLPLIVDDDVFGAKHASNGECVKALKSQLVTAEKRAMEAEDSRERLRAAVHMGGALSRALDRADAFESRLRESEAREAVLVTIVKENAISLHIMAARGTAKDPGVLSVAMKLDELVHTLPARSAAVLAVLDAARAWKKQMQEIIDGDFTISCPADFLDSWEMELYEAIRKLDKEVLGMSWLEDKIKGWEASDDVDWLKAQLEVMTGELAAAEKRADEAEGREQNLIIDNANMSEAAASCLRRAEALESRLRDAEAREAATLEILERIWHFATDDPTDLRAIAKEALTALPARSAAVLAVLDAARKHRNETRKYSVTHPYQCKCELCKFTDELDKEV